jgi:ATP-binding cassette subfamily F protein 3
LSKKNTGDKAKPAPVVVEPIIAKPVANTTAPIDKEAARKDAAQKREQTRPIRKRIEQLEKNIEAHGNALSKLDVTLADVGLYEANRKAELLKLLDQQQQLKAELAGFDDELLEQMMTLDNMLEAQS